MLWRFIATLRAEHAAELERQREEHSSVVAGLQSQIEDYKQRERAQSDRAVVQAERTLPVIAAGTETIAKAMETLERDR